ncbi:MAG TPA: hypothetical protein VKP88_07200, partial [Candidatus Paceibacterota bacterium]|nr:hypothetical protein [Candidatus Paceibacterota bacterium]
MIQLWDNHILGTVTIDQKSESPYYEFDDALTDTRLSRRGRTLDVDGEWITFDFGSAVTADYCAILAHNITSGATVKIQANSSDSWAAPPVDETIDIDQVETGTVDDTILHNFTSSEYRYWRLYIDDDSNSDGYIEIGYIFIGEYTQWPGMDR